MLTWIKSASPVNSFLFPLKPSSYTTALENLIWIPVHAQTGSSCSSSLPSSATRTNNGIPALHLPPRGNWKCDGDEKSLCILYLHGNYCDIGEVRNELLVLQRHLKQRTHIVAIEYPGYGLAKGSPSEASVDRVVKLAYDYISNDLEIPPQNLCVFGRSIGTGPCVRLCQREQVGAMVTQSAYTSIGNLAQKYAGWLSVFVMRRWDSLSAVKDVDASSLFIHGALDDIIPVSMSQQLYHASPAQHRTLHLCDEADHNVWQFEDDIVKPIKALFEHAFK